MVMKYPRSHPRTIKGREHMEGKRVIGCSHDRESALYTQEGHSTTAVATERGQRHCGTLARRQSVMGRPHFPLSQPCDLQPVPLPY